MCRLNAKWLSALCNMHNWRLGCFEISVCLRDLINLRINVVFSHSFLFCLWFYEVKSHICWVSVRYLSWDMFESWKGFNSFCIALCKVAPTSVVSLTLCAVVPLFKLASQLNLDYSSPIKQVYAANISYRLCFLFTVKLFRRLPSDLSVYRPKMF